MDIGKLFGVGIGSGDPQYLTLRAADVLKTVDVIFTVISKNSSDSVSTNVVKYLDPVGKIELLTFSMSRDTKEREAQIDANAERVLNALEAGKNCAFATLGDPMTYSTFGYILKRVQKKYPQIDVEIVPGVTSFATLAARAKQVLVENRSMLRVVPSFKAEDVENLEFPPNSTTILLKTYRTRTALLERLRKEKEVCPSISIMYGEELGMEGELFAHSLEEIAQIPEAYLSMIMVKK